LSDGVKTVICDNTNIREWQFCRYIKKARDFGYIVAFVVMPHPDPKIAAERNIHGVPEATIRKMIKDWED
jgi:predicted ABC-type ATPase